MTSLSDAMAKKADADELEKFKYANLKANNMEAWDNIRDFYGIDDDFPFEYLYYQKTETQKNIVLLNPGLHMAMLTCKKKYKLETVNLGLRLFQKNKKESKSEGRYRIMQEGLATLLPHLDDTRIVRVPGAFFEQIVATKERKFTFE